MRKSLLFAASLAFASSALAQYKWVDQSGRVQYGDTPPAGARSSSVRAPSPRTEAAAEAAKDETKKDRAPATIAEKEADFRKRAMDGEKEREKQAQARKEADQKRENCARARENVRVLESGRVTRVDGKGERYFLDDSQLAHEMGKARHDVQEWCN